MAVLAVALVPTSAHACPGVFNGKSCNSVCTIGPSPYAWSCDVSGGSKNALIHMVTSSSGTIEAYGATADGTEFCCSTSYSCGANPISVAVFGSDNDDQIKLVDTSLGTELECTNAFVFAEAGDDSIRGSNASDNWDSLNGEAGSDVIHGGNNEGNEIDGGDGPDTLYGGDDDDVIDGGPGVDRVKAGDGDDIVNGGPGDDDLCGGDGQDSMYGDGDDDNVFGAGDADVTNDGGSGVDHCENDSSNSCLFLDLTTCPW